MKREILFKAKRVDNGEWVYGYYVYLPNGKHLIYCKPFGGASQNTYHEVLPETVCQYTGLEDKNGDKIFEGDEIEMYNHDSDFYYSGFVVFDELSMSWGVENKGGTHDLYKYHIQHLTGKNIHD